MSLNSATLPGTLSVEDMNALIEGRMRVDLPGGFFKVTQQTYSAKAGVKVYQSGLPLSMVVRLTLEGRGTILEPAPAQTSLKHAN